MVGFIRNLFKHRIPRGSSPAEKKHISVEQRLGRQSDFGKMPLDERIVDAIGELGFIHCTPVQKQALPPSLEGKDVTAMAQTGTGKTAAFLISIIQHVLTREKNGSERPKGTPLALVLAPTRELAIQIGKDADDLSRNTEFNHLVVFGGMGYQQQADDLKDKVDLVVATPGRLMDYMRKKVIDVSSVEILVIDEADRMLDMGFIPDMRRIIGNLPPKEKRQTLLFSATLSKAVLRLADQWMTNPVRVEVEPEQVVASEIEQLIYSITSDSKLALLLHLINQDNSGRILVFRNRRVHCEDLHEKLRQYGVKSAIMTGDVPQKKRMKVLEAFREGSIPVIVATDVAGRGIHVDNITHVVNYDLPYEPDDYVHRIGRTGRAGVKGVAVSFACEESAFVLPEIEEYIGQSLRSERPSDAMLKLPHPKHPPSARKSPARQGRGNDRRRKNNHRPRR